MRIDSLAVETAGWRYLPPAGEPADTVAQIDLLFVRDGGVITLCEMKYSSEPFKLDKRYARALEAKRERFIAQTGTRKDVQIALVTPRGLAPSLWAEEVVDNVVDLDDLFSHP